MLSIKVMIKLKRHQYAMVINTSYRSSTLTGKFVHNHHTYENSVEKGCSAPSWRTQNENKTMGAYMTAAGYKTGFFGKILQLDIWCDWPCHE